MFLSENILKQAAKYSEAGHSTFSEHSFKLCGWKRMPGNIFRIGTECAHLGIRCHSFLKLESPHVHSWFNKSLIYWHIIWNYIVISSCHTEYRIVIRPYYLPLFQSVCTHGNNYLLNCTRAYTTIHRESVFRPISSPIKGPIYSSGGNSMS